MKSTKTIAAPNSMEPNAQAEIPKDESRQQKRIREARERQYEFEAEQFDNRLIALMDRFLEEWDGTITGYGMETIVRYDDLWKMTASNHNNHKKVVCHVRKDAFKMYLEQLRHEAAAGDSSPEENKKEADPSDDKVITGPEETLTHDQLCLKYGNAMDVYNPKVKTVLYNGQEMTWPAFIPMLQNTTPGAHSGKYMVVYDEKLRVLVINEEDPSPQLHKD